MQRERERRRQKERERKRCSTHNADGIHCWEKRRGLRATLTELSVSRASVFSVVLACLAFEFSRVYSSQNKRYREQINRKQKATVGACFLFLFLFLVLERHQHLLLDDHITLSATDAGNDAICWCSDSVFHLHGFDNQKWLTLGHSVTVLGHDLDNLAGHWRSQRVLVAGLRTAVVGCARKERQRWNE